MYLPIVKEKIIFLKNKREKKQIARLSSKKQAKNGKNYAEHSSLEIFKEK
jgi:hypothetical protein